MRIVVISDTHQRQESFGELEGDVLVHCGDMFDLFADNAMELRTMDQWFGRQKFDVILCTGGNHDVQLSDALTHTKQPFENAIYLQDESFHYGGLHFWGAPWVPNLPGHAFHKTDRELTQRWELIPPQVDVLITHAPPRSILDQSRSGHQWGCHALLQAVRRTPPVLHLFGHVHASRGELTQGTRFVNASSVRSGEPGVLPPTVLDL